MPKTTKIESLSFCQCHGREEPKHWHIVLDGEIKFSQLSAQLKFEYEVNEATNEYEVEYFVICNHCDGFIEWVSQYKRGVHDPLSQRLINGVIVNPQLRFGFDSTPHTMRSRAEYYDWIDVPFVVGKDKNWVVKVLDEGSHDRTSDIGYHSDMNAAIEQVKKY